MSSPAASPVGIAESHEDVVRIIEASVSQYVDLLPPVDKAWQPTDYLPDLTGDGWHEGVEAFRRTAQALSDEVLVVLVGDMITEEALPNYSVSLNQLVQDRDGDSPAPWAQWLRGWTAEENRHGDLLNAYLRLTGRVNMRAVEQSVHALIVSGFNPNVGRDPYNLLVYTSFQERATRISHANVARLAQAEGDPNLARICRTIAGDEARHETFYTRSMANVLDIDPDGGVLAFYAMVKHPLSMPGTLMGGPKDPGLFDRFAVVAQRAGVYTAHDYAAIVEHLVNVWNIAGRAVSGEAARAQEKLCRHAERCVRVADRVSAAMKKQPKVPFAWIDARPA